MEKEKRKHNNYYYELYQQHYCLKTQEVGLVINIEIPGLVLPPDNLRCTICTWLCLEAGGIPVGFAHRNPEM